MATRPQWVNRELFPFDSHFVEVEGARVHYIDEGQDRCLSGSTAIRPGRFCTGTS
jgi:hypothetical protein